MCFAISESLSAANIPNLSLCRILRNYLVNVTIFRKHVRLLDKKCAISFSLQRPLKTFLRTGVIQGTFSYIFLCLNAKGLLFVPILPNFKSHDRCWKIPQYRIWRNSVQRESYGRTDGDTQDSQPARYDDTNVCFSQLRSSAYTSLVFSQRPLRASRYGKTGNTSSYNSHLINPLRTF